MKDIIEFAKAKNRKYNHFITIKEIRGKKGSLSGYYFSLKDSLCVKGVRTTAGSRILENYVPPFSSTVFEKLINSGAAFIGKTNMDEFGFGSFGINSAFGPSRNPIDPERVTGGSSSGAGGSTKLLEKYPYFSIGESTGGSIANPAAFCSVYSITPTYGLVSRWGLISYADSLDKIGVLANDPLLVFKVLEIISGADGKDPTCIRKFRIRKEKVSKVGVLTNTFEFCTEKIKNYLERKIEEISESFKVDFIEFKFLEHALWSYYIIATSEASTNLARYCGLIFGKTENPKAKSFLEYFSEIRGKYFGLETKRRIIIGTIVRSKGFRNKYYLKAQMVRRLVIEEYKKLFKRYDVLLSPVMPIIPPKIKDASKIRPIDTYRMDILTVPPNLACIPHFTLPVRKYSSLLVMADHFQENKILGFLERLGEIDDSWS